VKKQRLASTVSSRTRQRETQATRSFDRVELWIAATLAVATLAVYGQVIRHQFINLDDNFYIWDNPMIIGGLTLKGIGWAFTTFHAANWHPLTWVSHMVDSQVFGLNAGGHLFMNALIHVSNTLLLFFFLKRTTGASWRSAMVAALFALHPLHVESVAGPPNARIRCLPSSGCSACSPTPTTWRSLRGRNTLSWPFGWL